MNKPNKQTGVVLVGLLVVSVMVTAIGFVSMHGAKNTTRPASISPRTVAQMMPQSQTEDATPPSSTQASSLVSSNTTAARVNSTVQSIPPTSPAQVASTVTATSIGSFGVSGQVYGGAITNCYSTDPQSTCGKPQPIEGAIIDLKTADGSTLVAQGRTDSNGDFIINVAPGSYLLVPEPVDPLQHITVTVGNHSAAFQQAVTVTDSAYVSAYILYD